MVTSQRQEQYLKCRYSQGATAKLVTTFEEMIRTIIYILASYSLHLLVRQFSPWHNSNKFDSAIDMG